MKRILDVDFANRTARVQAGVTNLDISEAVSADGFFYAPDPCSQLACTIGGNIGMNSGGAHCLKYGVTTNNLLGVKMVLIDGTVVDLGGEASRCAGLRSARPGLRLGRPARHRHRSDGAHLRPAEGARPVLFGFDTSEEAGACVADIIGAGIIPVAIEFMDKPAIEICEAFAHAGYPLDVGALLIIEVEGSEAEMDDACWRASSRSPAARRQDGTRIAKSATESGADLEGPQIGLRRHRPHRRLYLHGRHGAAGQLSTC